MYNLNSRSLKMIGNTNAKRKLSPEKVAFIRSMQWRKKMNMKQLASSMNLSYSTVQKVVYGERWGSQYRAQKVAATAFCILMNAAEQAYDD